MSDQERNDFEAWAIEQPRVAAEDDCFERDRRSPDRYASGAVQSLWLAYQAGASRAALAQQAVPEIDYDKLIKDCYRITKQARGTRGCVWFKLGAEWFREQVLAAAPAAPQASQALQALTENAERLGLYDDAAPQANRGAAPAAERLAQALQAAADELHKINEEVADVSETLEFVNEALATYRSEQAIQAPSVVEPQAAPQAEQQAALVDDFAAHTVLSQVARHKVADMIASGYRICGYTIERDGHRRAVVFDAAWRWLDEEQWHTLMFVEGSRVKAPAALAAQQAEREPLTNAQIAEASRAAHIDFALCKHQTYEHALTRSIERAHGIGKEGA